MWALDQYTCETNTSWGASRWNVILTNILVVVCSNKNKQFWSHLNFSPPEVKCLNSAVDISLFSRCRKQYWTGRWILLSPRGKEVRNRRGKKQPTETVYANSWMLKNRLAGGLNWLHTCCEELSHPSSRMWPHHKREDKSGNSRQM